MFTVNRIVEIDEYFDFIIESLHPDSQSISDHLFSYYKIHKTVNHKFREIISNEIQGIINAAQVLLINDKNEAKIETDYKSKKFAVLGRNKVLVNIPEDNNEFYLKRMTSINQLNEEYLSFSSLVDKYDNNEKSLIKIDWDPNSKNHLYFVLKELKNTGLIKNSVNDLAIFVKENFPVFSETSIGYIIDSINKGKEPSRGSTQTAETIKELKRSIK